MEIFIGDLKKDSWFWGMCCDRYAAGGGDANNKKAYAKSGFGGSQWNRSGKKARARLERATRRRRRRSRPAPPAR